MTEGPQMARLRSALAGASETQVSTAAEEWRRGAKVLDTVKLALEAAKPKMAQNFGAETRGKAVAAFETMTAKVEERRTQMLSAASALDRAHTDLVAAQAVRDKYAGDPLTDPGPFQPDPDKDEIAVLKDHRLHSMAVQRYNAAFQAREEEARQATERMDGTYETSAATLREIHGEPDPATNDDQDDTTGGGGSGPGGPGRGPGGPGPVNGSGNPTWVLHPHGEPTPTDVDDTGTGDPGADDTDPGPHDPVTTFPPVDPGVPQGPGTVSPTGPGASPLSPVGAPTGSTPGAVGGVVGAIGGGLVGGLAGISGAVRGGGVSAVPASSTAANARSIGSSSRTGSSSALGRGASAAGSPSSTRSGAAGSAGRGAAAGGARGAGGGARGAGGAGAAGGRGRSGSRTAGSGGGAAGAGGTRNRAKDKPTKQEFFEDAQDWIDDEGGAPGVID